jgi:hypothetical protein
MATVTTSFFGKYDVTVNIATPISTIDVFTETDDSLEDNTLQENRQEFRVLPREILTFIEEKIKAAQKNAGVNEIQMDLDLFQFRRWDDQLDKIFLNHRNQERWILSRDINSSTNTRELRLNRRLTPITLTFPLN